MAVTDLRSDDPGGAEGLRGPDGSLPPTAFLRPRDPTAFLRPRDPAVAVGAPMTAA